MKRTVKVLKRTGNDYVAMRKCDVMIQVFVFILFFCRAKEEARRQQAQAESEARQKIENERAQELARKEAHRKEVEASLPSEPPLSQGDGIAKIRFRLPNGDSIERRFDAKTPLKVLFDFLTVKGFPREEYKVIASWPRRDVSYKNLSSSVVYYFF